MKLLLFSDVHCDRNACETLVFKSGNVDAAVCAGDTGNIRMGLQRTIDVLAKIAKPTVLVPGNSESDDELRDACANWNRAHVLHGNGCRIDGIDFYGIGGGIPITPFGSWSFDFSEQEAESLLKDCPRGAVLVTHSPPKGIVDRDSGGRSLGSRTIYRVIEELRPKLVVCGHIHGCWEQKEYIGDTPVINAGPNGIIYEI
ncbi:MAG: serine/threonine protein phosphatase [bacterium]|nr:serine/threonine protein phosphatase [bacterium]